MKTDTMSIVRNGEVSVIGGMATGVVRRFIPAALPVRRTGAILCEKDDE